MFKVEYALVAQLENGGRKSKPHPISDTRNVGRMIPASKKQN